MQMPFFPLSSAPNARHSPSGHAVFASPVLCRTVAVLLQASCRYPTFTQLNPWINRHERKHGASYGFKNKQKKVYGQSNVQGKRRQFPTANIEGYE